MVKMINDTTYITSKGLIIMFSYQQNLLYLLSLI